MSAENIRAIRENLKRLGINEEGINSVIEVYLSNHEIDIEELLEFTNNFKKINELYNKLSGKNITDE